MKTNKFIESILKRLHDRYRNIFFNPRTREIVLATNIEQWIDEGDVLMINVLHSEKPRRWDNFDTTHEYIGEL